MCIPSSWPGRRWTEPSGSPVTTAFPPGRHRWATERDALAADITARGFERHRNTFTRSYGSSDVDAALLVLPLVGIEPAESPRVRGTIDAVMADLDAGGSLLYRYRPGDDGVAGSQGGFLACSFWLVQALAVTGRVSQAAELVHALVAMASPLGLYAEEIDPATGRHLGNYPQTLTHAALVQAALALRDAACPPAEARRDVVKKALHRD